MAAEMVDIAIAVDIPLPRSLGPSDAQPVRLDIAKMMGDPAREQGLAFSKAAAEPGVAAR